MSGLCCVALNSNNNRGAEIPTTRPWRKGAAADAAAMYGVKLIGSNIRESKSCTSKCNASEADAIVCLVTKSSLCLFAGVTLLPSQTSFMVSSAHSSRYQKQEQLQNSESLMLIKQDKRQKVDGTRHTLTWTRHRTSLRQ